MFKLARGLRLNMLAGTVWAGRVVSWSESGISSGYSYFLHFIFLFL